MTPARWFTDAVLFVTENVMTFFLNRVHNAVSIFQFPVSMCYMIIYFKRMYPWLYSFNLTEPYNKMLT